MRGDAGQDPLLSAAPAGHEVIDDSPRDDHVVAVGGALVEANGRSAARDAEVRHRVRAAVVVVDLAAPVEVLADDGLVLLGRLAAAPSGPIPAQWKNRLHCTDREWAY